MLLTIKNLMLGFKKPSILKRCYKL